jgi:hypothetical protein
MECHLQGIACIGQCSGETGRWKGMARRGIVPACDLGVSMSYKPSHSAAPPGADEIFS